MNDSINVVRLRQPDDVDDPLTDVLRAGARRLLAQAVELEAEAFLAGMQELKLPDGRARLVRHGHGPERPIQTGIGAVGVSRVKIRDRGAASDDELVRFSSAILPKWSRRTRSLDALLPVLYLRGVSTGDFQVGVRESAQSWRELLVEVKRHGLTAAPELAIGDGALGLWKAIEEIYPGTRHQRCWVHKTANVLNKVPKSIQPAMKDDLREVHGAPTRAAAEAAIAVFDKSTA